MLNSHITDSTVRFHYKVQSISHCFCENYTKHTFVYSVCQNREFLNITALLEMLPLSYFNVITLCHTYCAPCSVTSLLLTNVCALYRVYQITH